MQKTSELSKKSWQKKELPSQFLREYDVNKPSLAEKEIKWGKVAMWGKNNQDKLSYDFVSLLKNSMVILKGQYFFWWWDNFFKYLL